MQNCRLVRVVYVETPYQQGGLAGHVLLQAGKAGKAGHVEGNIRLNSM